MIKIILSPPMRNLFIQIIHPMYWILSGFIFGRMHIKMMNLRLPGSNSNLDEPNSIFQVMMNAVILTASILQWMAGGQTGHITTNGMM